MKKGIVYLVGAGPGDPELITVKALNVLRRAEVVVYDSLIPFALLQEAPAAAELIAAGKRAGKHLFIQEKINALLLKKARAGKLVVRLKGGDPFLFGRGGEEALFLKTRGITVKVIPGISSSFAVPLAAGIPLTQRSVANSLAVISGSDREGRPPTNFPNAATLIVLMPKKNLGDIAVNMLKQGFCAEKPAALVENGTKPNQQVIRKKLRDFAADSSPGDLAGPAIFIVGQTVSLAAGLGDIYEQYTHEEEADHAAKRWQNSW